MKKCDFTAKVQENSVAVWLLALCGFLLGIIVGFCWSPVKHGVTIGCNNVSNTSNEGCCEDADDEEVC
jgi:hypothetical protein